MQTQAWGPSLLLALAFLPIVRDIRQCKVRNLAFFFPWKESCVEFTLSSYQTSSHNLLNQQTQKPIIGSCALAYWTISRLLGYSTLERFLGLHAKQSERSAGFDLW